MKLKQINKNRLINNTATNFWIKTSSVVLVGASVGFGFYFYFYQADRYLGGFIEFSQKYFERLERKQIETQNRPLQQNAYQRYLEEKKIYNQQLEEETRRRLERIRSLNISQNQTEDKTVEIKIQNQSINKVENTEPIEKNEILPEQKTEAIKQSKPGLRKKLVYYLTLGYVKY
ncbi:unnamed protein product [Brachionus calyciflorus]|uniref:Uncharacterized protein n=1 Tax=Brachionus calyciflorus TaxID=104777 RepID=A0A814DW50_9BILA|nr:unnamed protein product [Brachionus calyciflorus]